MAYSFSELRNRLTGNKPKVFDYPLDKKLKVFIPYEAFTYRRTHFKIQVHTPYKSAKFNTLDCLNQNYGEQGSGCPICEYINNELWAQWRTARDAGDDASKKSIQAKINALKGEEMFVNAFLLDDPTTPIVLRLTMGMYKEIEKGCKDHPISEIIWKIKKTSENTKVTYFVDEDHMPAECAILWKTIEGLHLPDLDKTMIRHYDLKKYKELLNNHEVEVSEEEIPFEYDDSDAIYSSTPPTKTTPPKADKPKADKPATKTPPKAPSKKIEVEEDSINIDDIDIPMEEDKPAPKKEPVKEPVKETVKEEFDPETKAAEDDLDISLDELGLDELDEPKEKMTTITKDDVLKKKLEKPYITAIYNYFVEKKELKAVTEYKEVVTNLYKYAATKNSIQFPSKIVS